MGRIPNRLALAGGWIDQPFISRHNPAPPGSMVVVGLEPTFRVMDRAGSASGTRAVAMKLWNGRLPARSAGALVRELYHAENRGKSQPSGSQDMAGAVRYVTQALVSSGEGWLDADPEIQKIQPDIYAVNEDGDKGGKREYCSRVGIEYLVLKRIPAPGLPQRSSTDLRGF